MVVVATTNRWLPVILTVIISAKSVVCFTSTLPSISSNLSYRQDRTPPSTSRLFLSSSSSTCPPSSQPSPPSQPSHQPITATSATVSTADDIAEATRTLQEFDRSQQQFMVADGSRGLGGGLSALHHVQSLDGTSRAALQRAVLTLSDVAGRHRAADSSKGRIMLGFCAANAPEALAGLKSWVTSVRLPRGMLHGMDVDGVPIPVEDLGAVYVKYSTGGAMTFTEMRETGRGLDALWRPGDAVLEGYDGDFRGIYYSVELEDGEFRQFGVLPTDLFMEEEEW